MIKDETGNKELPISTILQESIRYFFVEAFDTLSEDRNIKQEDVYWVLTVPANWNNVAKQMMKMSAEKVNFLNVTLLGSQYTIYCMYMYLHVFNV